MHPNQDPFLYLANNEQRLRFSRVLSHHGGIYSCIATNEAGHDELQFDVQVLRKLHTIYFLLKSINKFIYTCINYIPDETWWFSTSNILCIM